LPRLQALLAAFNDLNDRRASTAGSGVIEFRLRVLRDQRQIKNAGHKKFDFCEANELVVGF
jgi:hypothetical protein